MNPKLIVALDFAEQKSALALIEELDPGQCALKVGSEMFTLFGTDFVHSLVRQGYKIFLDLKFHDIPTTVAKACSACAELGVWMITIHAAGGLSMMQAAKEALNTYAAKRPLLVAVTVLTSMKANDLPPLGLAPSIEKQVNRLASLAQQAGVDGVVCSAFEVPMIKTACGSSFLTVTPGIRLTGDKANDQSRVMTPAEAIAMGSDFLVVGRPITQSKEPKKVVQKLIQIIHSCS